MGLLRRGYKICDTAPSTNICLYVALYYIGFVALPPEMVLRTLPQFGDIDTTPPQNEDEDLYEISINVFH